MKSLKPTLVWQCLPISFWTDNIYGTTGSTDRQQIYRCTKAGSFLCQLYTQRCLSCCTLALGFLQTACSLMFFFYLGKKHPPVEKWTLHKHRQKGDFFFHDSLISTTYIHLACCSQNPVISSMKATAVHHNLQQAEKLNSCPVELPLKQWKKEASPEKRRKKFYNGLQVNAITQKGKTCY